MREVASCSSARRARIFRITQAFEFLDQLVIISACLFDFLELDCLGQFRYHELTRVDHLQRAPLRRSGARARAIARRELNARRDRISLVNADGFHVEEFGPQGDHRARAAVRRAVDRALRCAAACGGADRGRDLFRSARSFAMRA